MRVLGNKQISAKRIAILPGSFDPPTLAHLGLAEAALSHVDYVLLTLPSRHPTKQWVASREDRLQMMRLITEGRHGIAAADSPGELYIEIADDAAATFPQSQIVVICGADTAELIVRYPRYREPGIPERFFRRYEVLIAPRGGVFCPPEHLNARVQHIEAGDWADCSSTDVRTGGPSSQHLVPDEIRDRVQQIYWPPAVASRNVLSR